MITRRGGMRRRVIMLSTVTGSIVDLVRGLWRSDSGKRWLVPLAVFLARIRAYVERRPIDGQLPIAELPMLRIYP